MPWAPTTDEILDLNGVRRRRDAFRFELCDREWKPIGDLHPDRTGSVVTISNDVGNQVPRRLSAFKLLADELTDVHTLRDRLRVYMQLQNGAEFRLGSFMWGDENTPRRSWGLEQHSELVDPIHILNQKQTQAYGWGRGTTITLIMFFLLFRAGFELADIRIIGPEAARGLADPISWQPGTTWLQMLTDLGNLVGFAPAWADRDGLIILDQPPIPGIAPPTVPEYTNGTRIIRGTPMYSNDSLSAANDFGAFDSGTDRIRTGRYQVPPIAPHSFQNRGFRIGETVNIQGTATQAQADKAARNLAATSDAYEQLTFDSTADPRHDTYDVVPAFDRADNIQQWLETSWSLECRSGGKMAHTLRRVLYDVA